MIHRLPSCSHRVLAVIAVYVFALTACARSGDTGGNPDLAQAGAPAETVVALTERPQPDVIETLPVSQATSSVPVSPSPLVTPPSSPLPAAQIPPAPVYTYQVVAEYPHDSGAFTQGLVYTNGVLYEGTGLYGRSSLRKVDLQSGEVLRSVPLADEYFGEGITLFGEKIYQLTWQEQQGFIYREEDFAQFATFEYATEGWGLTHDGEQLIMSDGSATLFFRDPETLEETRRVLVTSDLGPVTNLNELEYVNGEVYANIWQTDWIARIDPESGLVVGWIDLRGLLGPEHRQDQPVDVLNGIAYDAENDRLFVTGKLWPRLFEIELFPAE